MPGPISNRLSPPGGEARVMIKAGPDERRWSFSSRRRRGRSWPAAAAVCSHPSCRAPYASGVAIACAVPCVPASVANLAAHCESTRSRHHLCTRRSNTLAYRWIPSRPLAISLLLPCAAFSSFTSRPPFARAPSVKDLFHITYVLPPFVALSVDQRTPAGTKISLTT